MHKFIAVLKSRKFWALVASLVSVAGLYTQSDLSGPEAANAIVAAFALYSLATGIEDSGKF